MKLDTTKEEFDKIVKIAIGKVLGELPKDEDGEMFKKFISSGSFDEAVAIEIARQSIDPRFKLVGSFEMVVPKNYSHECQLAMTHILSRDKSKRFNIHSEIVDKNFNNVIHQIVPGGQYLIKVFKLDQKVIFEDCLEFLKLRSACMVGVYGLSLIWQIKKKELEDIMRDFSRFTKGIFSFDGDIFEDYSKMPSLKRDASTEIWSIFFNDFGEYSDRSRYILYVEYFG